VDGRHVLLAEDAEAMAAACVRLLRDVELRRRLAANGRELVERAYAWEERALDLLELWRWPRDAPVARAPAAATALAGRRSP
jgi:glycosyltransferase involved in cell wall biosynthesis